MSTKTKIIDALGCALDDVPEDLLLDILLDAYAAKKNEIGRLNREVDMAHAETHREHERMKEERHRMRSDPTYCLDGAVVYFLASGRPFSVVVQNRHVNLHERMGEIDVAAQSVSLVEWLRAK